jgi:hypothetical protein
MNVTFMDQILIILGTGCFGNPNGPNRGSGGNDGRGHGPNGEDRGGQHGGCYSSGFGRGRVPPADAYYVQHYPQHYYHPQQYATPQAPPTYYTNPPAPLPATQMHAPPAAQAPKYHPGDNHWNNFNGPPGR